MMNGFLRFDRGLLLTGFILLSGISAVADVAPSPQYQLVWADEFDYEGAPAPDKWSYEEGFLRNKEKQFYTLDRRENARVENGCLVIEGRKEHVRVADITKPGSNPKGKFGEYVEYTSASLNTWEHFTFCYGKVEVRAKLPLGKGVWPAIWTLGVSRNMGTGISWPAYGEIDIMEYVGFDVNTIHRNVHFLKNGVHKPSPVKREIDPKVFHVYTLIWTPEKIEFYVDQQMYGSFVVDEATEKSINPFRQPHFLLINLALGGSWGKEIDDTVLPQQYLIDYVRVYRQIPENK